MKINRLIPALIAALLIFSDARFNALDTIKKTLLTIVSPIYFIVDAPQQFYHWISDYGTEKESLLAENRQLGLENLRLKSELQTRDALLLENQKLNAALDANYKIEAGTFALARVGRIRQSRLKKQLVISGRDDFAKGQIVLGAEGVIGRIAKTAANFAIVPLISDPTQFVPVKNIRSGVRGVVQGMAQNVHRLRLRFVEADADVKVGDVFATSGIDAAFPPNYPVGTVVAVRPSTDRIFLDAELVPAQTLQALGFVLVGGRDDAAD